VVLAGCAGPPARTTRPAEQGNPAIAAGIPDFLAGRAVGDAELDVGAPVFARSKRDLVDPRGR